MFLKGTVRVLPSTNSPLSKVNFIIGQSTATLFGTTNSFPSELISRTHSAPSIKTSLLPVRSFAGMANTKFEYVRKFEHPQTLLQNCWIVVRLDGHSFHEFCSAHGFTKPNDLRALRLMTACAAAVMTSCEFTGHIVLAYGQSDEYSFIFARRSDLWKRREMKIVTNLVSIFTALYVLNWPKYFDGTALQSVPSFDGRAVLYPTIIDIKNYLCWRQADCHINNQYNTCFWTLVQDDSYSCAEAAKYLRGTTTADKNEYLYSKGVNYNDLPAIFKKGTVLVRIPKQTKSPVPRNDALRSRPESNLEDKPTDLKVSQLSVKDKSSILEINEDLIRDDFWDTYPHILEQ
eukprot:Lankesteria_metandrocarpae@DN5130_c0_g1_i1.p1